MISVDIPNLPSRPVKDVLIGSCAEPLMLDMLKIRGVRPIITAPNKSLRKPVAAHADLLYYHIGKNRVLSMEPDSNASLALSDIGFQVIPTTKPPGPKYPEDAALDAARVGNRLICNPKVTDPILLSCPESDLAIIPVRQGYAKCSVCIVDEQSIITADEGIARAAEQAGIVVLRIRPGYIKLTGFHYGYGFLGGCCGKIAPDCMAFAGDPRTHPDYERIADFLKIRGVFPYALSDGILTDIGGILPLTETE